MINKLWREPLIHFLLLGAVIFAVYSLMAKNDAARPTEILISQAKIEHLANIFTRTWQRPPTQQELEGLIREHIREEVAYREAVALGLDTDDTIIRRRLRQKLEFVSDELVDQVQPTDNDLQQFLITHPEKFKSEPTFTFHHVYLNPQKHGSNLQKQVDSLLEKLQKSGGQIDLSSVSDSAMLERAFMNVTEDDIARTFGEPFSAKLTALGIGRWYGPIESGYGVHLVLVEQRTEGSLPALNLVRDEVRREWENQKRKETTERFYDALLQRYSVKIETSQEKKLAEMR